jgi:hypothetical protein
MTQSFDRGVERQIQKALAEGQLSGLKGEGKAAAHQLKRGFCGRGDGRGRPHFGQSRSTARGIQNQETAGSGEAEV